MACFSSSAREVTSSRRPERGLPPASTASSQLCRRRHRKRRRGNRLTSPPDHAGAARADRSDKSDLCKESGPRAKRHWRHEPRGGATAARRACRCGQPPTRESRWGSDSPACCYSSVSSLFCCLPRFLLQHLSNQRSRNTRAPHRARPAGSPLARRTPPSCCFQVSPQNSLPARSAENSLHPVLTFALTRAPREALSAAVTFPPPLLGFLYSSCSVGFLRDTWETTVSYGICQSMRCFYRLGFALKPFFEYLSLYTSRQDQPTFLKN